MDHMELPHRHGNNEELSRLEHCMQEAESFQAVAGLCRLLSDAEAVASAQVDLVEFSDHAVCFCLFVVRPVVPAGVGRIYSPCARSGAVLAALRAGCPPLGSLYSVVRCGRGYGKCAILRKVRNNLVILVRCFSEP